MTRIAIPRTVKDKVLKEFNHRCAICGADKPHIHHIDENPSNNNLMNLIPLCPNCHLLDQHNPTAPIDSRKLLLFREYKDPNILSSKFEPLFRRILFLFDLNESTFITDETSKKANELLSFIKVLKMGEFYSREIQNLIGEPSYPMVYTTDTPSYVFAERDKKIKEEYFHNLIDNREHVISLIIELLRYQEWTNSDPSNTNRS